MPPVCSFLVLSVFFAELHILAAIQSNGEICAVEWLPKVNMDHARDLLSRNVRQQIVVQFDKHGTAREDFFLSAFYNSHILSSAPM